MVCIGAALSAANHCGESERALSLFDSMEVEPNHHCWVEALTACCAGEGGGEGGGAARGARCDHCLALLERMPAQDQLSYNAVLDVLPGSIAKTVQMVKKLNAADEAAAGAGGLGSTGPVTSVLLVSGPRGTGRSALVAKLMESTVTTADGQLGESSARLRGSCVCARACA